jgi:lipid-binding SYLF domain-containing protein
MHRYLIAGTAAVALSGLIAAAPAFAETNNGSNGGNGNEANSAQQLVNDATNTVQKIKADSHFDALLKQAKGVFIMPTLVKGALVVGGQGAQGVLLRHESNGAWSEPAFLTLGSVSVGAQAGGKAGPAAMILMTDKALNDFTQQNNFSLNGNAGLTIIGYSAQGQAPVGKGDIVVWSDQSGAFAGANVSGADLTQNTTQDHEYYGKAVTPSQILANKVTNPGAAKLRSALPT